MAADQPSTNARERLRSHFIDSPSSDHPQRWDDLYQQNFLPWDKGLPNPALVDLLTERQDLLPSAPRKKALIPGCGKGYDVMLLSAWGYDAYGLDYSETALTAAREIEKEMAGKGVYEKRDGVEKGKVVWVAGDFFKDGFLDVVEGEKTFDLIYDYTFLSALPVSLRPAWSARFAELLAPGGRVVCVEFPTYKPHSTGGPPWALPPKVYEAHLPRPGVDLLYDDEAGLLEERIGPRSKNGLQRIAHFQPPRTHEIGYDENGKMTDWVGVWSHQS